MEKQAAVFNDFYNTPANLVNELANIRNEPENVGNEPVYYYSKSLKNSEPLHGCAFNGALLTCVHVRGAVILIGKV